MTTSFQWAADNGIPVTAVEAKLRRSRPSKNADGWQHSNRLPLCDDALKVLKAANWRSQNDNDNQNNTLPLSDFDNLSLSKNGNDKITTTYDKVRQVSTNLTTTDDNRRQLDDIQRQLTTSDDNLRQTNDKLTTTLRQLDDKQRQVTTLNDNLTTIQRQLTTSDDKFNDIQRQYQIVVNDKKRLLLDLESAKQLIETLSKQGGDANKLAVQVAQLETELKFQTAKIKELQIQNDSLKSSATNTESEKSDASGKLVIVESLLHDANVKIIALEKTNFETLEKLEIAEKTNQLFVVEKSKIEDFVTYLTEKFAGVFANMPYLSVMSIFVLGFFELNGFESLLNGMKMLRFDVRIPVFNWFTIAFVISFAWLVGAFLVAFLQGKFMTEIGITCFNLLLYNEKVLLLNKNNDACLYKNGDKIYIKKGYGCVVDENGNPIFDNNGQIQYDKKTQFVIIMNGVSVFFGVLIVAAMIWTGRVIYLAPQEKPVFSQDSINAINRKFDFETAKASKKHFKDSLKLESDSKLSVQKWSDTLKITTNWRIEERLKQQLENESVALKDRIKAIDCAIILQQLELNRNNGLSNLKPIPQPNNRLFELIAYMFFALIRIVAILVLAIRIKAGVVIAPKKLTVVWREFVESVKNRIW